MDKRKGRAETMEGTELLVMGVLAAISLGAMVVCIFVYVYRRDTRMTTLESEWSQMVDVMENLMWYHDREMGQLWDYMLSSRTSDSKGEPK